MIAVGIVSVLSVLTLRDDLAGATGTDAAGLTTVGQSLVAVHDATFLLGPAFCAGLGNGLLLGYLMYRSALVPPRLALLGLIGGSLLILSFLMILMGVYKNGEGPSGLLTLPEAAWELLLGIYCAWKGFRLSSPIAKARGDGSSVSSG
jgi:hypothetical protein